MSSTGFGGRQWLVHKFGGTSVADAKCFEVVTNIILEKQLGLEQDVLSPLSNLAIVVSAMGGKPKVTDLLLDAVKHAAARDEILMNENLALVLEKHNKCLKQLFQTEEQERLLSIVEEDLMNVREILKTVSLMKWQAHRISELVSGYGELWSTQILTALLNQRVQRYHDSAEGSITHKFVYLDARRVITVDEDAIQDGAIEWDMSSDKLKKVFDDEVNNLGDLTTLHFVVTGYVASNTEGVATTLQRDGSDYSAAIMGRLLQATSITIWTDVDGVLSADPRRVPLAQVLPEVSYNEAMELAYFGAKVIHPKTMQPAISSVPQIPIYIRNTFNASFPGTKIFITSITTQGHADKVVCGFSTIERMSLINVEGSGMIGVPGVAMRIFGTLERCGINVVLISQGSSEHSVSFATMEVDAVRAKEAIEDEFARELKQNRISSVDVQTPCSIIAAVGDGMSSTTGVSGRFFSALGDAKINVLAIAQGSSERNISAVVFASDSTRALRAVHAAFNLSHSTIRVGIVGMGEVGESLLKLLETRRGKIRSNFDIDLQVCTIIFDEKSGKLVTLKRDDDVKSDSITFGGFKKAIENQMSSKTAFEDETNATLSAGGLQSVIDHLIRSECTNHCIFDCTNDASISRYHAEWLRCGVDVVTANNMGLSGPKEQRIEIKEAEKALGKQSAKYLRQVTVAGGLPILNTVRSLLHSGDSIRRIDGIFTVVSSYIMYRISPPSGVSRCSEFDKKFCKGAFEGDLSTPSSEMAGIGLACSFSQAVKEAMALGLTEENPLEDLNNEYMARTLMVLARELGIDDDHDTVSIQQRSEQLVHLNHDIDFNNIPADIDRQVKERVDAAASRGCVLRSISSIDVKERMIDIEIAEVPSDHVFATSPPSCACVRFFTKQYRSYPLVIQGPSAGADSTASALLAELLQRTIGMSSPRSLKLSQEGSGAALKKSTGSFTRPA